VPRKKAEGDEHGGAEHGPDVFRIRKGAHNDAENGDAGDTQMMLLLVHLRGRSNNLNCRNQAWMAGYKR